jgi:hypothetical protein
MHVGSVASDHDLHSAAHAIRGIMQYVLLMQFVMTHHITLSSVLQPREHAHLRHSLMSVAGQAGEQEGFERLRQARHDALVGHVQQGGCRLSDRRQPEVTPARDTAASCTATQRMRDGEASILVAMELASAAPVHPCQHSLDIFAALPFNGSLCLPPAL